jgi:ribosome-binding protein aMBF1 (putative translation factor)
LNCIALVDNLILKQSKRIVKRLITSAQIRAARALLRWSAEDLADKANIGIATIRRFEVQDGTPSGQIRILEALKLALEAAGIEFIGTAENGPGVRLSPRQPSQDSLFAKQTP